jgi:hypothetical protein
MASVVAACVLAMEALEPLERLMKVLEWREPVVAMSPELVVRDMPVCAEMLEAVVMSEEEAEVRILMELAVLERLPVREILELLPAVDRKMAPVVERVLSVMPAALALVVMERREVLRVPAAKERCPVAAEWTERRVVALRDAGRAAKPLPACRERLLAESEPESESAEAAVERLSELLAEMLAAEAMSEEELEVRILMELVVLVRLPRREMLELAPAVDRKMAPVVERVLSVMPAALALVVMERREVLRVPAAKERCPVALEWTERSVVALRDAGRAVKPLPACRERLLAESEPESESAEAAVERLSEEAAEMLEAEAMSEEAPEVRILIELVVLVRFPRSEMAEVAPEVLKKIEPEVVMVVKARGLLAVALEKETEAAERLRLRAPRVMPTSLPVMSPVVWRERLNLPGAATPERSRSPVWVSVLESPVEPSVTQAAVMRLSSGLETSKGPTPPTISAWSVVPAKSMDLLELGAMEIEPVAVALMEAPEGSSKVSAMKDMVEAALPVSVPKIESLLAAEM